MNALDYAALAASPIGSDPFTHVVVPQFVPAPVLPQVVQGLPALSKGGSFPTGCLRLGDAARALIEDYAVEVPPVNGTLLVFPNGPTTWHGHKQFIGRRYVIQLNWMTTDDKARYELRRHKVSAFMKRLTRPLGPVSP